MTLALLTLVAAPAMLTASVYYRTVLAAFAAVIGAVAAAASLVTDEATPGVLVIALGFTAIAAGLVVIGQIVWKSLAGR